MIGKKYQLFDAKLVSAQVFIGDKEFALTEMHADHIRPWAEDGSTVLDNCQLVMR